MPRSTILKHPFRQLTILLLIGIGATGFWIAFFPSPKGTLEIRLKDHREAIGDFAALEVSIKAVRLSPKTKRTAAQAEWKDLRPSVKQVDLTRYTGKDSAVIFNGKLARGRFEAIHLTLDPVKGILKKTNRKFSLRT